MLNGLPAPLPTIAIPLLVVGTFAVAGRITRTASRPSTSSTDGRDLHRGRQPGTGGTTSAQAALERLGGRLRRRAPADRWGYTLSVTAREVRSGSSLLAALHTVAEAPDAPVALHSHLTARHRLDDHGFPSGKLLPASDASRDADEQLALATIDVLIEHGGHAATVLDRAAAAINQRRAIESERRAQAAQARMSARVLGGLAPGFALWTVSTDERVRSFLLGSAPGWACLSVGALLSLVGAHWMRRLVRA